MEHVSHQPAAGSGVEAISTLSAVSSGDRPHAGESFLDAWEEGQAPEASSPGDITIGSAMETARTALRISPSTPSVTWSMQSQVHPTLGCSDGVSALSKRVLELTSAVATPQREAHELSEYL
jgi:hypothetical protein